MIIFVDIDQNESMRNPQVNRMISLRSVFRGRRLPIDAYLAGYSALIDRFDLDVPLHHEMAAVAPRNTRRKEDGWTIYPAALCPSDTVIDNLVFALKYEGVQLLTLKRIFQAITSRELELALRVKPTSGYIRRLCFFYEMLIDEELDVPNITSGAYVNAIDPKQQYCTSRSMNTRRYRVRDNLPGTKDFCPLVFRTRRIDEYIDRNLSRTARDTIESAPRELIARAAAFLLLSDSKASFAIEGENPPKDRITRWGNVIGRAGRVELSRNQLIDLQRQLIGDDRFVHVGLRKEGGFVGRHDALGQPEPEHISANADDLDSLLDGLSIFNRVARSWGYDPVLAATSVSFGFVYIHPFEDGNGRIHRFLLHHVLAEHHFTPEGIIFPISSAILHDIARYKDVLESVSRGILQWIDWEPTERGNVRVRNDTGDFYRYFDATAHCEYIFKCIERVVEKDLPEELAFLAHRDEFHRKVTQIVDMGERTLDRLLIFLRQGHGRLSARSRRKEFAKLRPTEIEEIQDIYERLFSR